MTRQSRATPPLVVGCLGLLATCAVAAWLEPNSAAESQPTPLAAPVPGPTQATVKPVKPVALAASVIAVKETATAPGSTADEDLAIACLAALDRSVKTISVEFGESRTMMTRRSDETLKRFAAVARTCPTARIKIQGHTDNSGRRSMNLALSQDRADAVKKYLVEQGLSADSLTAVGFGPDHPVASNKTPSGRAKNRRIEFRVVREE